MKNTLMIIGFLMLTACASYNDAIEGSWNLDRIKNEYGEQMFEAIKDDRCDVVELTFTRTEDELVVIGHDEDGKELKSVYIIKEDGRLISKGIDKPNMYILDIQPNEIVLSDIVYDPIKKRNLERLLVFKRAESTTNE